MTTNLSAAAARVKLPAAPIPVPSETRDAAIETIEAEQWLQTMGWREPLLKMSSPQAGEFLEGYRRFRAMLDESDRRLGEVYELADELGGDRVMWRRIAIGALTASVIAVGMVSGLALF